MAKSIKSLSLKKLDVVVLTSGKVFQVIDEKAHGKGAEVLWMDKEGYTFIYDDENLFVEKVIRNSPTSLLVFAAARSIHLRLNNLNKV